MNIASTVRCCVPIFLLVASFSSCFGEWTKTIQCSGQQTYRDVRKDAGREELCELDLPGSLTVKDGPYRSWFSEGHPGSAGSYLKGREVGEWQECDRFDRCRTVLNSTISPSERERKTFKPQIPVWYEEGKYVFDFASCRSTWISQTTGDDPISLNIGGEGYRCEIAYLPQSVMEHGGKGDYFCRIPFSVGTRRFETLNLMRELPNAGLPQFCHSIYLHGEPLMIREGPMDLVTTVDVTCASIDQAVGPEPVLTIELNSFASDLALQVAKQEGPLNTLLCLDPIEGATIAHSSSGTTSFIIKLSRSPAKARKQIACVHSEFQVPSCN
jgi:hypothetical protein